MAALIYTGKGQVMLKHLTHPPAFRHLHPTNDKEPVQGPLGGSKADPCIP